VSDPGRLSPNDITVNMTVLASNDPYGIYTFANGSLHMSIAEDFTTETVASSSASLLVQRTHGAADYVQVVLKFR